MIGVFKYIKPFFLIALIICFSISYLYLKNTGVSDLITMIQTMFGGKPLYGIMLKSLFIMIISLLQYTLIDYIAFYIDNAESLFIRYGNKIAWLKALLKGALMLTALFVFLLFAIALILNIFSSYFNNVQFINMNTIEILVKVYLFCTIAVFTNIYLLLKFTKTSTFMIMSGISIIIAITNYHQVPLSILPLSSSPIISLINMFFCLFIIVILVILIKNNIVKKELSSHEN